MTALLKHRELNDIQDEIIGRYLTLKHGRTKEEYTKNLNKFFTWLYKRADQQIRPDVIQEYKLYLEAKDLKASSINAYLSPVKDFFTWAYNMEYMPMNVGKYVTNSKKPDMEGTRQARALTEEEVCLILMATSTDTLKEHSHRIMLLLMFNLGMRISEVMGLKVEDMDFSKGLIRILGKGQKIRTLGLTEGLTEEIQAYIDAFKGDLKDHDYLIQTFHYGKKNTKPGTGQHGNRLLKKYAKLAGVDTTDIRSHSGRVTAINYLLDQEVSMRDVANFAGHTSVDTTRRYDRKDQERIKETCNIIKFI